MAKDCTKNKNWIDAQSRSRETLKTNIEKRSKLKIDEYNKNPILCKNCTIKIPYGIKIKGRKFCSIVCSSSYNNKVKGPRDFNTRIKISTALGGNGNLKLLYDKCIQCEIPLKKRSAIKFCSHKCHKKFTYDESIRKWKAGEISGGTIYQISNFVRTYIKNKYNNKCARCGWNEIHPISKKSPLNIDHIDGNSDNNLEENLILICPNCHSLTPTYGSRNKNSGRTYRKIQRKNEKIKELELDLKIKNLQESLM